MKFMNKKAVLEIGSLIHVTRTLLFKKLPLEEIINSYEYQKFKEQNPELCRLAEEDKGAE